MNWRRFIPTSVRLFFGRKYADAILDEAIEIANKCHEEDGRRYFVLPTKSGNLKVTNGDYETRERVRDKRLLKKSVRKPYQLRRESYYFTASRVCKEKYQPQGMQDFELEAMRKVFYRWYFRYH